MTTPAHKRDHQAENARRKEPLVKLSDAEITERSDQLLEMAATKLGRPSTYNHETATEIVRRIGQGETLAAICDDEGMPSRFTVYWWSKRYPDFGNALSRARALQGEAWGEMAVTEVMRDVYEGEQPDDRDAHARAKARAMMARTRGDILLRAAGRRDPEHWGDKPQPGAGVQVVIQTNLTSPELPEQSTGVYTATAELDSDKPDQ